MWMPFKSLHISTSWVLKGLGQYFGINCTFLPTQPREVLLLHLCTHTFFLPVYKNVLYHQALCHFQKKKAKRREGRDNSWGLRAVTATSAAHTAPFWSQRAARSCQGGHVLSVPAAHGHTNVKPCWLAATRKTSIMNGLWGPRSGEKVEWKTGEIGKEWRCAQTDEVSATWPLWQGSLLLLS